VDGFISPDFIHQKLNTYLSRLVITKLYIVNEERMTPLEINASITVMYFWTGRKPSGNVSVNDKGSLETWLDS